MKEAPAKSEDSTRSDQNVALLIIDMQKDFVLPGAPACVARAAESVETIARLLGMARVRGWTVFHIIRDHAPDGADAEVYRRHLFQNGGGVCVSGSSGAEILSELSPIPGEHIVPKTRFSAFYQTGLETTLREIGVETLVLSGTQYPNCVRGSAMDALYRDFRVIIVTDGCSAADRETEEANIRDMRGMGMSCVPLAGLDAVLSGPNNA